MRYFSKSSCTICKPLLASSFEKTPEIYLVVDSWQTVDAALVSHLLHEIHANLIAASEHQSVQEEAKLETQLSLQMNHPRRSEQSTGAS